MTPADRQMLLFTDLPTAPAPTASPSRRRALAAVAAAFLGEQLAFRFVLRDLERDDIPEPGPVHRIVKAADAEPLKVIPVSSIFGLGATFKALQRGRFGAGQVDEDAPPKEPAPYRVERSWADGVHRVIRQRPEETPEWQEKERARRAKQRPPKPTRKAKTRSKKLLELIGDPDD